MRFLSHRHLAAVTCIALTGLVAWRQGKVPHRLHRTFPAPLEQARLRSDPSVLCAQRIAAAKVRSTPIGPSTLERARGEIVGRARANSVLFLREPTFESPSPEAVQLRQRLLSAETPWSAVEELLKKTYAQPLLLRQVLLREGYFYFDSPALAALLTNCITLRKLFSEPLLTLTRGGITRDLVRRKDGEYTWADDSSKPEVATLLLFDRVAVASETRSPDFHVSITEARSALYASAFSLEYQSPEHLIGTFEYGDKALTTLLNIRGNVAQFECEVVPHGLASSLTQYRAEARKRAQVMKGLRAVIEAQVDETLPFDEPKTEEGQQDGKLRQEWETAYLQGASQFKFNGDSYSVFDLKGRPRTPQVCVDFITESWERLSGTRWLGRGGPRSRQVGRLDFDALPIENRRSVENLLAFATGHGDWFEVLWIPESERVPFANRRAFFEQLKQNHLNFAVGDMVAILGPRDDERLHYHSFFIVEDDPITGIATRVAANAGRPRIRTWEAEMQNAPRRAIVARIRPKLAWLQQIVGD